MTRPKTALLACAVLVLSVGLLAARSASEPVAARAIAASISVDGDVVLRAGTSDDGHPDADRVWGYLADLDFKPTEAFASLSIGDKTREVTLGWLKGKKTEHLGPPPALELEIGYGGHATPYELTLVRGSKEGCWRVAPEIPERWFSYRTITRAQAADLEDPRRKK